MPMEIDLTQRLATIAEATLDLVATGGIDAVSIRAVAKRIGGSTTLVTNYLPTREDLLRNAVEHALTAWDAETEGVVAGASEQERLAVMVRWACSTTGDDAVLRRLFMEILGRSEPDSDAVALLRQDARQAHDGLAAAAEAAGASDAAFTADILHLVLRGFYLSSLEDPQGWPTERIGPLVDRLVNVLLTAPKN
ncbi:TetR/AcrR family transcriptional regulator [Actinocorallia sp. A-T 12471]|uniref:TetR/AcrR family transcriptional regulator n=1 Tax=Actinocorallia sp. A-T 12471 TaxID=3089813 RepID=UPI0029CBDDA8|nr:TetR/AcrR family transcriptional regulator [Actinocorallia sp. A-T 12471]MDX6741370.1 TetR/AcrR family transcriptional regulator [Actinocorallia sp. A-T 12471]